MSTRGPVSPPVACGLGRAALHCAARTGPHGAVHLMPSAVIEALRARCTWERPVPKGHSSVRVPRRQERCTQRTGAEGRRQLGAACGWQPFGRVILLPPTTPAAHAWARVAFSAAREGEDSHGWVLGRWMRETCYFQRQRSGAGSSCGGFGQGCWLQRLSQPLPAVTQPRVTTLGCGFFSCCFGRNEVTCQAQQPRAKGPARVVGRVPSPCCLAALPRELNGLVRALAWALQATLNPCRQWERRWKPRASMHACPCRLLLQACLLNAKLSCSVGAQGSSASSATPVYAGWFVQLA